MRRRYPWESTRVAAFYFNYTCPVLAPSTVEKLQDTPGLGFFPHAVGQAPVFFKKRGA